LPYPSEGGIVRGSHRTGAAGERVKVINIVAMRGHNRVIAFGNQYQFTVAYSESLVNASVRRINSLYRITFGSINLVIVDLFKIYLVRWPMNIVLVRWVARPVSARRVDLNQK